MPNAAQLRHDAEKLRQKANIKRKDAEKITLRAAAHTEAGEYDRATAENKQANGEQMEALQIERTAMEYEQCAADLEAVAFEHKKRQPE